MSIFGDGPRVLYNTCMTLLLASPYVGTGANGPRTNSTGDWTDALCHLPIMSQAILLSRKGRVGKIPSDVPYLQTSRRRQRFTATDLVSIVELYSPTGDGIGYAIAMHIGHARKGIVLNAGVIALLVGVLRGLPITIPKETGSSTICTGCPSQRATDLCPGLSIARNL
jgi:hypothetical protein